MGWLRSKRQCLIDDSSRRTIGRPVPRLILQSIHVEPIYAFPASLYSLVIEPVQAQPNSRRNNCRRCRPAGKRRQTAKGVPRFLSSSSDRFFPLSSASFSRALWRPRSKAMRIACPLGSQPLVLHAASNSMPDHRALS